MITTISDLLLGLKNKEQELLKKYDIVKHPGIIGDMYEGLTKEILQRSVFEGLDLHVRAGKIRNSQKELSGEIDCMLVIGEGEKIPYTDKYFYDSEKVIAVIQVKKNLFSKDIKDSYENLKTVIDVTETRQSEPYHNILLRDSWRSMFNEELPSNEQLKSLPIAKEMIYHILLLEAFYPTRIVWGYNGFKSEFALRNSFIGYLEENITLNNQKKIYGFGPLNLPNLIICDKFSLIKGNGIPYVAPINSQGWWPLYFSSNNNPVNFLLEVVWTRLQYMFAINPLIFGEDLKIESVHPFLFCQYQEQKYIGGWLYNYVQYDKALLEKPLENKDWEPCFLTRTQFEVINELCKCYSIDFNNNEIFIQKVEQNAANIESFIESLKLTGLVDCKNNIVSLITEQCVCGITSSGKYYAGENKTGRVSRWVLKFSKYSL
jgi:hypothetical protein